MTPEPDPCLVCGHGRGWHLDDGPCFGHCDCEGFECPNDTAHRYDPETCRCTCGELDHPEWGVTA